MFLYQFLLLGIYTVYTKDQICSVFVLGFGSLQYVLLYVLSQFLQYTNYSENYILMPSQGLHSEYPGTHHWAPGWLEDFSDQVLNYGHSFSAETLT